MHYVSQPIFNHGLDCYTFYVMKTIDMNVSLTNHVLYIDLSVDLQATPVQQGSQWALTIRPGTTEPVRQDSTPLPRYRDYIQNQYS